MEKLLLVVGLCIQSLGMYTVWFSRRNIIAHQAVGFVIIAYFVPVFFSTAINDFPAADITFHAYSTFIGGLFYLIGIQLSRLYSFNKAWIKRIVSNLQSVKFRERLGWIVSKLMYFAIFALIAGYLIMGFIPAFADDPLQAKQFKGPYRDSYLSAAWIFRAGFVVATVIMPIAVIHALKEKRRYLIFGVLLLAFLIVVSLAKTAAALWLLLVLGVISSKKRTWTAVYLLFLILLNFGGSVFYYLIGLLFGLAEFSVASNDSSFANLVASGAPDIADQLTLISAFLRNGSDFTLGRTFFGGMVPFSYEWNPAVWTLAQINDTNDVSDIASGGLRLPASLWGYVSFGWVGVIGVSLLSGFILGCFTRISRFIYEAVPNDMVLMLMSVSLAMVGMQIANFFTISLYLVPPTILIFVILQVKKIKFA